MATRWCCSFPRRLIELSQRLQLELRGSYSVDRLHALRQYELNHPRKLRTLLVPMLVPLPCLLLMIALDVVPLGTPSDGFDHQRVGFYIRALLSAAAPPAVILWHFSRVMPQLTISKTQILGIATAVSVVEILIFYGWSRIVGFPAPFAIHVNSGPMVVIMSVAMWTLWKHKLRADASVCNSLKRRVFVVGIQVGMLSVYFTYIVVFKQLSSDVQSYFTVLLPLIKLVFKHLINHGIDDLGDLVPSAIVSYVDIFHTLFVSLTMRSGTSHSTTVFIMAVDTAQNLLALYELASVLKHCQQSAQRVDALTHDSGKPVSGQAIQPASLQRSVTGYTMELLASNPRLCSSPGLAAIQIFIEQRSVVGSRGNVVSVVPTPTNDPRSLSERDTAQLTCVQLTLKLVYMVEFYVLIEFVEVMMASFYAAYLYTISFLSNRVYYTGLKGLSAAEIRANARVVATYAALELVSLVVFCYLVQRRLKGHSTLNQVAFALESHWWVMQGSFIAWVLLFFNMTLEHYGTDTTFKFEWLKANKLPQT